MRRYAAAYQAEWLKTLSVRSWWVLGLVMVLYIGFTSALLGLMFTEVFGEMGVEAIDGFSPAATLYTLGSAMGYLFPVLLGALAVTTEYRYHTITPTFLSVGRRGPVLAAKVTVQGLMGAVYGVAALLSAVLGSVFFFIGRGMSTGLTDGSTWLMFLRMIVAMGLWGIIGVGLGALIRSQAAAIVVVLVFTQFIEPLARMGGAFNSVAASITRFLPGSVSDAFVGQSIYTAMTATGSVPLSWWVGGLVLAGYGAVLVLVAYFTRWRSDVS